MYEYMIKRGDILLADLGERVGSEKDGIRPVIVIQNDKGNYYSDTFIVAPFSAKEVDEYEQPTHVIGIQLKYSSTALLEQITTIDRSRIVDYLGGLNEEQMKEIDEKIRISLDV